MYWTDSADDVVRRANLDGSVVETLVTGLQQPRGIELDVAAGKMYWTDGTTLKVQRANLDGSGAEDLVVSPDQPAGLALDPGAGKMYWANVTGGKIERANLDGSGVEDFLVGLGGPYGVALDLGASRIYWTRRGVGRLERARLSGADQELLLSRAGYTDARRRGRSGRESVLGGGRGGTERASRQSRRDEPRESHRDARSVRRRSSSSGAAESLVGRRSDLRPRGSAANRGGRNRPRRSADRDDHGGQRSSHTDSSGRRHGVGYERHDGRPGWRGAGQCIDDGARLHGREQDDRAGRRP